MAEETTEQTEAQKIWQNFLQKCCESGRITFNLDQLDGQKRQLEKMLEVTNREVKSLAAKHKEVTQTNLAVKAKENNQPTAEAH